MSRAARPWCAAVFLATAFAALAAFAAGPADEASYAPDRPEPGSVEAIAAATTEPRFLSPWVAYVPESDTVPSPTDFLGHIAGAPGELSRTGKVFGYFRALAAATKRVHVETMGKSEEGRDMLLVAVGDETAIAGLEGLRQATATLADPRRCDAACAEKQIAAARPIYYLNGGLHSTETGSPEMLMELAYRLAVSERPEIRAIREHLLVLINPVAEPDGRDRTVDWYYRFLKGKTDYDNLPETSPPYWGKYAFHDNNRDVHQRGLALTRAIGDMYLRWHPQVMHDLHESVPLLLIWTGTDPQNVNLDPINIAERMQMSFQEVRVLSAFGMPGVWTWGFGDAWAHMYVDSIALNHNAVSRGYETFGITSADTMDVRLDLDGEEYANEPVTRRTWYRPWPPPRQFRWSLRNNTNYMETGVLSILEYSAQHASELLHDFYNKGRRAVERGRAEKPYAIAIPEEQDDRGRLIQMVNLLRAHGIEVSRLTQAFRPAEKAAEADEKKDEKKDAKDARKPAELAAGTFVVRLDQPYRGYALDLLQAQDYPAGDVPYTPYDDVSWCLPVHFGVEVKTIDDPGVLKAPMDLLPEDLKPAGRVSGEGPVFALRDRGQEALLAARHRLAKFRVEAAETSFKQGSVEYPAGSWIVPAQGGLAQALRDVSAELGLDFDSLPAAPGVRRHPLDLPRLAVLATWNDTEATGWVRMWLDNERVPYTYISDDDIKRGGLEKRFDVILVPHTGQSIRRMIEGIDPGHGPMPYTKTAEFPSHGTPLSSPDITGGLTHRGVANVIDFVNAGGVLVTLGGASALPLDGGMVRRIGRASAGDLQTPGVELRARFARPDHPLAYGYPEITSVFRADETLYETREADLGWVVLQWGTKTPRFFDPKSRGGVWVEAGREAGQYDEDEKRRVEKLSPENKEKGDSSLVVSGGMKGEDAIQGKPALLDVPVGKGRVVAFLFDPIHRLMTRSDFRMVWNAILNWNDMPPPPPNPPRPAAGGAP
ncbi:MAG TPA: M14 family zinc carboxypeptidase [Candidatus Polarisedimenticolia bacterium]|nr:M14 family zinc carboxypeptidase [Candidatus Polarisedimenticolia bacterium]